MNIVKKIRRSPYIEITELDKKLRFSPYFRLIDFPYIQLLTGIANNATKKIKHRRII